MPLGTEIGLGQGDIALDGHPAAPERGTATLPLFVPCLLWPNGWMHEDATLYGSRSQPRPHCVRRGPSYPAKGAQQPMSIVATVAHLRYC